MSDRCTDDCCAYAPPGWEREYEREAADQYAEQAGLNRPRAERVEAAAEYRRRLLAAAQALRPTAGDGHRIEVAEAKRRYRETHSREGYPLGGPEYPDNREGRRRLARTWKGHQP